MNVEEKRELLKRIRTAFAVGTNWLRRDGEMTIDGEAVKRTVAHIQALVGRTEGLGPVSTEVLTVALSGGPVHALRDAEGHPMTPTGWSCGLCGARTSDPIEAATEEAVWASAYGACFGAAVERYGEETEGLAMTAAGIADMAVAGLRDLRAESTPEQTCELCGQRPGYNHECSACTRVAEDDDGADD